MAYKEKFVSDAQLIAPGFNIQRKQNSKFMKFLSWLVKLYCPRFMTDFETAVGNTVYLTEDSWASDSKEMLITLAHELRHIVDKQKRGSLIYALSYLFPQILALGSLFAFLAIWFGTGWLWALCCLVFLAPIPSPGRAEIEKRGYSMSLAGYFWVYGRSDDVMPGIIKEFTNSNYYFMWPFKKRLERFFDNERDRISKEVYDFIEEFVHDFLKQNNFLFKKEGGANV